MSRGGIHQITVRDERFDKYLKADDYLRARLDAVRAKRKGAKEKNIQPTHSDLIKTHLMYTRSTYKPFVAVSSEYSKATASGDGVSALGMAGGSISFALPNDGNFTSDVALRFKVRPIGTTTPVLSTNPAVGSPLYRFCAYPGVRVVKHAEFRSAEVLVDDYTSDDVSAWMKFFVGADQLPGWNRCMGQQEARTATFYNSNGYTQNVTYMSGPQTPKFLQEAEFWIPLQFDMCTAVGRALLNDMTPATQRKINIELAPLNQIIQAQDQNGNIIPLPFTRALIEVELYINNLYVNPEIYDIFASRIGSQLIRIHRRQKKMLTAPQARVLMDQIKYPTEYLMVGIRNPQNLMNFDQWWLMGTPRVQQPADALTFPAAIWNSSLAVNQLVIRQATDTSSLERVAESLSVESQTIPLFPKDAPVVFYNGYLANRYFKETDMVAPQDASELLVPFNLFPGKFNPSGYYNMSAARELYLNYSATAISSQNQMEMVVSASTLNFLMRKGDTVTLRFSM